MNRSNRLYIEVAGVGGAVLSTFVANTLSHMVQWLVVMAALIICDLVAGVCKAWKIGEQVSVSRAIRDTIAKGCTYFSAVVFMCLFQSADADSGIDYCLYMAKFVCAIEGVSIVGNILKWHGYNIDGRALFAVIARRIFGGEKDDYRDIVNRDDSKEET